MDNSIEDNNTTVRDTKPLGEILMESGLITANQLEIALQQQEKRQELKIGEVLASHKWVKQQTADFFAEQWQYLLQQKQKKPLVYYFRHSGILDEKQINLLLQEQKQQDKPTRFHRLAVERGYIKQITVDFFLANIFKIYHSNVFSFAKPYEILSKYNKGEKNFRRTELCKAPLIGVTLKGIYLDGSNLREATMSTCNLSNSSLVQTNLAAVNLVKSILTSVNFERANLCQANLREAHLKDANFTKANLQSADLTDAYLFNTVFSGADLRQAKLSKEYPYEVYYDSQTVFSDNFDPLQCGWKKLS